MGFRAILYAAFSCGGDTGCILLCRDKIGLITSCHYSKRITSYAIICASVMGKSQINFTEMSNF